MRIYAWKQKTEKDGTLGLRGACIADDMQELFWAIDAQTDPYTVEISEIGDFNLYPYDDAFGGVVKWKKPKFQPKY